MAGTLQDRAVAASWRALGGLSNAAFREADILYDPVTGKYYVFSTASYAGQGQVDMYVADTPEALASAAPIRLAPTGSGVTGAGVYPSCLIDPADGTWHLWAE